MRQTRQTRLLGPHPPSGPLEARHRNSGSWAPRFGGDAVVTAWGWGRDVEAGDVIFFDMWELVWEI